MEQPKDDSHIQYHTVIVRRVGQDPKEPIPAEYADQRIIEITNSQHDSRRCRGRSVQRVVLLGIKRSDLPEDMERALHSAQRTHQSYTGIAPTFIEVEPTL